MWNICINIRNDVPISMKAQTIFEAEIQGTNEQVWYGDFRSKYLANSIISGSNSLFLSINYNMYKATSVRYDMIFLFNCDFINNCNTCNYYSFSSQCGYHIE